MKTTTISDRSSNSSETRTALDPRSGHILIVDDEPAISQMLQALLTKQGYKSVSSINDPLDALPTIRSRQPDLVILDIYMPGLNGLELLRELRAEEGLSSVPVIVMTSSSDQRIRDAALQLQANDFLNKPVVSECTTELDARVYNLLLLKSQHDQLRLMKRQLEHEIEVRTDELYSTRREAILCMARAAESRDAETGHHVIRVGRYASITARQLGLDDDQVAWIELAAQLHDVGKLSIPDGIVHKPGKLTDAERAVMQSHCNTASTIFYGDTDTPTPLTSPLLQMAARIAETHHERWDGTGYPNGLAGEEIPIEGRITAVADVFDALSSRRSYKDAFELDHCFELLEEGRGTHFDPAVVDALMAAKVEVINTYSKWQDKKTTWQDRVPV